jgi:hypothetical protein
MKISLKINTMKHIQEVRNYQLPNVLHLQFFVALIGLIRKSDFVQSKIGKLYDRLCLCVEKEDRCYKIIRKSNLSALKAESDHARDDIVAGIRNVLRFSLQHFDIKVREAAHRLEIVFDTYNKPTRMIDLPSDAETVAIKNMLQVFEDKYASDIEIVGLKKWLGELRFRNNAFDQLATNDNEQQAEKPDFDYKEVRHETDAVYKDILLVLNGLMAMEGETEYLSFVHELNSWVKHYNDLLVRHLGLVDTEKEREKEQKEKRRAKRRAKRRRAKE